MSDPKKNRYEGRLEDEPTCCDQYRCCLPALAGLCGHTIRRPLATSPSGLPSGLDANPKRVKS